MSTCLRLCGILLCSTFLCLPDLAAQTKSILYITHSAGFRHDSIPVSIEALQAIVARTGRWSITATEDLDSLAPESLREYDAVLFFTSGELALSEMQRAGLLDFIRDGGGFGGFHSATDTLYNWAEYGELIGGYFDGHPWVHEVRIDVEDPDHPASGGLAPAFNILEEIYQFRNFSRDRVRVLMTLDTTSVDSNAPGAQQETEDFPLAWVRTFGSGRVFYSALGHFDGTWRDLRFQSQIEGALRWLLRETDAPSEPRRAETPLILAAGNAATMEPPGAIAPDSLVSIYGSALTTGSNLGTASLEYSSRLAGTTVEIGGQRARLLYASPSQINVLAPSDLSGTTVAIQVAVPGAAADIPVRVAASTPGVFAVTSASGALTVWATGVGNRSVQARVGGRSARVLYSGASPEFPGLWQVNLELPPGTGQGSHVLEIGYEGEAPFYSADVQT